MHSLSFCCNVYRITGRVCCWSTIFWVNVLTMSLKSNARLAISFSLFHWLHDSTCFFLLLSFSPLSLFLLINIYVYHCSMKHPLSCVMMMIEILFIHEFNYTMSTLCRLWTDTGYLFLLLLLNQSNTWNCYLCGFEQAYSIVPRNTQALMGSDIASCTSLSATTQVQTPKCTSCAFPPLFTFSFPPATISPPHHHMGVLLESCVVLFVDSQICVEFEA